MLRRLFDRLAYTGLALVSLLATGNASAQVPPFDPERVPQSLDRLSQSRGADWDAVLVEETGPDGTTLPLRLIRYRVDAMRSRRALGIMAFAQRIDAACPFFDAGVRTAVDKTLAAHLSAVAGNGGPRAEAFLNVRPCGHATTKAVQASLLRLLGPADADAIPTPEAVKAAAARLANAGLPPFPAVDQEVAGAVIGWSSDLAASLNAAKADGKPVLLLLRGDHCPWCDAQLRELIEHAALNRLAGRFHAVMLDVDDDAHAPGRTMFDLLGAKGLPTTSLFVVASDGKLNERVRLNGYRNQSEFLRDLAPVFPDAPISADDRGNWKALDAALARKPGYCLPIETLGLCDERVTAGR